MKTGTILKVYPNDRVVEVSYQGSKISNEFTVPTHLPTPSVGCSVLVDDENNILISIIDYPDSSYIDPISDGQMPGEFSNNYRPPSIIRGGDFHLGAPKTGYLSLLKDFVSILGAGPLSQVMFFGTKRLMRLIVDNIEAFGNNYSFKIKEGNNGLPTLSFSLGNFNLIIRGGDDLTLTIGNIFQCFMSIEEILIRMINYETKQLETVYRLGLTKNEKDESGKAIIRNTISIKDTIARVTSMVLKVDSSINISYKKGFELKGDKLDISTSGTHTMSAKEFSNTITGDGETKAGNYIFDIGTNGQSGSFQVLNGTQSKIEMNSLGNIKLKGMAPIQGIQLNGTNDYVANGIELVKILTIIISSISSMGAALSPIPLTAAAGAAGQSVTSALPYMPNLLNVGVSLGKPTANPKL